MPPTISGPLHAEAMGLPEDPPMIFVHPNPLDSACWIFQMAHFSTWYRTVAVDLPGYGRSPTATPEVTMGEIAEACWEAADRMSQGPAILVGCSVGSAMVQHMYHQRPESVRAIALSGTGYNPVKAHVPKRIAEYGELGLPHRYSHTLQDLSPTFRETPLAHWFAELFVERNDTADVDTIINMFAALGAPEPEHADLHAPVMIITGSEDNSHQRAFDLHDRLPDSELVTMEGTGHACFMEQPWVWDRHLLEFLDRRGLRKTSA